MAAMSVLLGGCAPSGGRRIAPVVAAPRAPLGTGAAAWEQLKRELPGVWTAPTKTGSFAVSYRLVSAESALVETWGVGGSHETITVFHPDHADLLLTHYCAQGNQPRLRVVSASDGDVVFRFVDATNQTPEQSVLVERTLRVAGDTYDDTEVYRGPDGQLESTTEHFRREKALPAPAGSSP